MFYINHSYNQENTNGYLNYKSIDRVKQGECAFVLKWYCVVYNFTYVKNACTEKSEHKYSQI